MSAKIIQDSSKGIVSNLRLGKASFRSICIYLCSLRYEVVQNPA